MKKVVVVVALLLVGLGVQAGLAAYYASVAAKVAGDGRLPAGKKSDPIQYPQTNRPGGFVVMPGSDPGKK